MTLDDDDDDDGGVGLARHHSNRLLMLVMFLLRLLLLRLGLRFRWWHRHHPPLALLLLLLGRRPRRGLVPQLSAGTTRTLKIQWNVMRNSRHLPRWAWKGIGRPLGVLGAPQQFLALCGLLLLGASRIPQSFQRHGGLPQLGSQ